MVNTIKRIFEITWSFYTRQKITNDLNKIIDYFPLSLKKYSFLQE